MDSDEIERITAILTRKKAIWCIEEIGNAPGESEAHIIGIGDERTKYLAIEDLTAAGIVEYDPEKKALQLTQRGQLIREYLNRMAFLLKPAVAGTQER